MHEIWQMQHLGDGQQWSRQGVLEGFCMDKPRFDCFSGNKPAEDNFTKLLANFEAHERPSTLLQSSMLTPFRRQRKSCRPLHIPTAFEMALRDDNDSNAEGFASIERNPSLSGRTPKYGPFFGSEKRRKPEPLSPTLKEAPHMEKLTQNGFRDDCPRQPTNLKFEGVITHQENGMDMRNLSPLSRRYALINDENSNGAAARSAAGLKSLPNFQPNDMNLKSVCSSVCRNGACQAKISSEVSFCRRCSCCICKLFDCKRDSSLWILCDPNVNGGCGLSCHIECALKQQVAGVVMDSDGSIPYLDGSYYCQLCHTIMPLICCWRDQLLAARSSLTLNNLHYRLFLCCRLLKGTKLYKDCHGPIEEAMRRVDAEVSEMALGPAMRLRCSVGILSCKVDVHRLIDLALEKAGSWTLSSSIEGQSMLPFMVCFEDVSSSSIDVAVSVRGTLVKPKPLGYKLWYRKASEPAYACTPTSIVYNMNEKCVVSNLHPFTDYTFKVVPFSAEGDIAVYEAGCSTKSTEPVEPPVDVYTSLGVLLINTEKVGGGTSRCMNQSFNLDYHNGKNGLKIQELEEVLVNHHEQGHHLNSKSSSTTKELKANRESFEDLVSVYSKRGARLINDKRGHLGQKNLAGVLEEGNLYSLDASFDPSKCKQGQTGMGSSSMKTSSYSSFDCDKLSSKCRKTTAEQGVFSDSQQCYPSASLNRSCLPNSNLPSQSWVRKEDGIDEEPITHSTQAKMDVDHRSDDHKQGVFTCNSEADFYSYEFSVKVIRWLECKGHLKEEFRMKFLTWFTLRASEQEKRVISVFIDTLQDDPASLAGQLVDAFQEMIGLGGCPIVSDGFCRRLW
ncbi:hypothetical protein L7F22_062878 [Adiantum nelumboides]|nr:hypothetical protein [Adiantum nelumboides]